MPATLLFDYPESAAVAQYLRSRLLAQDMPGTAFVMAEISKLEGILSALQPDSADGADVMARLTDVLSKWGSRREQTSVAKPDSELESATADEMFKIIEREFGKS